MFGAILTATNSSFQKGMSFCRSTYVKKVMKLLAFIFEQPSYCIVLFKCKTIFSICGSIFSIICTVLGNVSKTCNNSPRA